MICASCEEEIKEGEQTMYMYFAKDGLHKICHFYHIVGTRNMKKDQGYFKSKYRKDGDNEVQTPQH